jgi:hypothetical protein
MGGELIFGGRDEALEWGVGVILSGRRRNKGRNGIFAMLFWRSNGKNFIRG